MPFDLAAAVLCAIACATAWQATHDLEWPCESDLYRDLGTAQSILDGTAGRDPAYTGERWWYPPLVPAVVALWSVVARTSLHEAYTTAGIYLNLTAPIAFYAMLSVLCGRRAALAGLVGFLFLGQLDMMSWMHATYSPWLWACNFAQGLFYLAIAAVVFALHTNSAKSAVIAGVLSGLVALAHAAPALLLAVMGMVSAGHALWSRTSRGERRNLVKAVAVMVVVATIVGAPFWLVPLAHYRLRVSNPAPLTWLADELTLEQISVLGGRSLSFRGVVSLVGVVCLAWGRPIAASRARIALLAWGGLAVAGLGYSYASQRMVLPALFPSWHFYFSLQAFEAAAFGVGVVGFSSLASWLIRLPTNPGVSRYLTDSVAYTAAACALLALVGFRWKGYVNRVDLTVNREASLALSRHPVIPFYQWALKNLRPDDVVLAAPHVSFFAGAANRKVVALQDIFSNPYVSLPQRLQDGSIMLSELLAATPVEFRRLARVYRIRHAALDAANRDTLRHVPGLKRIRAAADRKSGYDIYELRPPLR